MGQEDREKREDRNKRDKRDKREEQLPTEREWLIMEAVWDSEDSGGSVENGKSGKYPTSAQILQRIDREAGLDARTERVLLHHLCKKGLLGYQVDARDSRVYHYYALRTREECLREKSRDFVNAYFRGSSSVAVAAFLRDASFTDEQIRELEEILEERKGGGQKDYGRKCGGQKDDGQKGGGQKDDGQKGGGPV